MENQTLTTTASVGVLAKYLTRDQLAAELKVSPRTITRWTFEPDGIPHLPLGNRTLYDRAAVLNWLDAHAKQAQRTKRRE
jgi:phage terminase Nu1 subunit (DNA packaging protein)